MKTNIELLIQALETPAERGCGICDHLRYSLHDVGVTTPQINEITRLFRATAISLMDYPLVARDANYFLFPLDPDGNYQQPEYSKGELTLNGIRASAYYSVQEDDPFEGELGATRLKLIRDVLARLKSKVEIFVDASNVHLLDGLIKQYNLSWGIPQDRTLEGRAVYGNYLIIDFEYKSLSWSENRYYPLATLQDLITKLGAPTFAHWEILDPKIEYLAMDGDGEWWGYLKEPTFSRDAWYAGGPPRRIRGLNPAIFPTCTPENSLIRKDNA